MPPRLAVCISGSGTNLQAIIDATASSELYAKVVVVVSNRKSAYGLVRAERAGIPTLVVPYSRTGASTARAAYDRDLAEQVALYEPDLVVLAGWMHILSSAFLDRFPGRVINLHPALPGAFPGVNAIQRAYEAYQRGAVSESGCMVHYAVPEVDAGPVIVQARVAIEPEDTLETFEARMHATEHHLIIEALRNVLSPQANKEAGRWGEQPK